MNKILKKYNNSKPFYEMTMKELLRYNKRCVKLDNLYLYKIKKREKRVITRNRKNRRTRKKRKKTRRILSKIF
jgi:hypothetical protein